MLEDLGLDQLAERVYRAMVAHPREDIAQLCARVQISEDELRAILDRLHELSLVRPVESDARLFHAVAPDIGVQRLLARQHATLASQQAKVERARLAATELIADLEGVRPLDPGQLARSLNGIDEIRDQIKALADGTQTELMAFAPGGRHSEASLASARQQDLGLLERGVRMRTVYLDSIRNHPQTLTYANELVEAGGEVRTLPTLPIRMMIVDRTTAVVAAREDDSAAGAMVLNKSGAVAALCALFELLWEKAVPLTTGRQHRADTGELDAQRTVVLGLLAQGNTDEVIAKRLGISSRTVRRISSELLEQLGARSRFQAGARAVARNWITGSE